MNIERISVGLEGEPVVVLDDFAEGLQALRIAAAAAGFVPAQAFYPGQRAALPPSYLASQLPIIMRVIRQHWCRCRRIKVIDASFSIVTTPPADLDPYQRVPHVDAHDRARFALVHFLSDHPDGTAFYRHRASGFETVTEGRAAAYSAALDAQLASPPCGYIRGDTDLFEQTIGIPAKLNRALLYRSYMLHSGAIAPDTHLSPDPQLGRLTITGFFTIE